MKLIKKQNGFTLTPALFILVLLLMAGSTYLIYVNTSGKASIKIEKSQVAKSAAETGLYHIRAQLSKLNRFDTVNNKTLNDWYNVKDFYENNYLFGLVSGTVRNQNTTKKISEFIDVKDEQNKIISRYRVIIETGNFLNASTKTITGSNIEGKDKYGNDIWVNNTDKNFHKDERLYRYGVRVDGFSVDSVGKNEPGSQSLYAVIDVPNNSDMKVFTTWGPGFPSGYFLSTNGYESATASSPEKYLTLLGGQIITGKIHSNNRIDFQWDANFDIFNPDRPNSINEKYTVTGARWSGAADNSPMLIRSIVREQGDPPNVISVYGTNFSLNLAKTSIVVNGSTAFNPTYVQEGRRGSSAPYTPTGFGTKIKFTLPGSAVSPYTIDITNLERSQTIRYIIADGDIGAVTPMVDPDNPPNTIPPDPLKIYGLMQVNQRRGFLSQKVYTQGIDYRFIGPPSFPAFEDPYIAWDLGGDKPATNDFYEATYITEKNIPHNLIKVFDNITYTNYSLSNLPNFYYIHAHKAPGTSVFPWAATHGHGEIFGMSGINLLSANKPLDYLTNSPLPDWGHYHRHSIGANLITSSYTRDLFFNWKLSSYKPKNLDTKIAPILAPNSANFKTQRKYADQIMKIIFNKNLSKDVNGDFNSLDEIAEDRDNGYYNMKGGLLDFRATYFGNDLKYYNGNYVLPLGSKISDTASIFVNDDPNDSDYMRIEATKLNSKYHSYTYRQIPKNGTSISNNGDFIAPGGIIFVRDGIIRIGGASYRGNVIGTGYTTSNIFGNNTIIDGRLTIISYTENKPNTYINNDTTNTTDNEGDIVITGNVIYKNRIYPWEKEVVKANYDHNGFKQYKSYQLSYPPLSTDFLTNSDGSPVSSIGNDEKVNGLSLIASNDIKIPVMHYRHPSNKEDHYTTPSEESGSDCPCKDTITISGQLIAGHKISQTKVDDGEKSKNDRLILYGSLYSYNPPNLSYFDRSDPNNREEGGMGRLYLFDPSLYQVQLSGTPSFPSTNTYDFKEYPVIGLTLPRIVPGTWKVVNDGAE